MSSSQMSLPLNNTAVSRAVMIAARFAQRSRAHSSRVHVLNDMVQSMSDAIHNPTRVGYYRLEPSGRLYIDTANCTELLDESHVRGILPSGPLARVIENNGFLYVPDILKPPKYVYLLDGNGNFVTVKPMLDRKITRGYRIRYGDNFKNGEKMDMVFGCLSVPGHADRPGKTFGAIRADSFSSGKSILPAGMQPEELLSVFSILGNSASQSLDELETRLKLKNLIENVESLLRMLKHNLGNRLMLPKGYLEMGIEQIQGIDETEEALKLLQKSLRSIGDIPENVEQFIDQINEYNEEVRKAAGLLQLALRYLRDIPEDVKRLIARLIEEDFEIKINANPIRVKDLFYKITGIGIEVKIDPNVPEEITTDKSFVLDVLLGLAENASKYKKPEQNKAIISVNCRVLENGKELEISVVDQGLGLSREQIDKIFLGGNRFNENIPGWGFGLKGYKNIVEKLGGRLWAESEGLGKGSTFKFTLPIT